MSEKDSGLLMLNVNDDVENMYLTFGVRDEEYAVNIACVTEIVGLQKISEVPDVPEFIRGVINLRGQVIPVMDVRLRFRLPWREYDDRTTIIVLELDGVPTGLVVDQVTDVVAVPPENVEPPPRWHSAGEQGVIMGLGKRDDGVSIILDVQRLVHDGDIRLVLPEGVLAAAKPAVSLAPSALPSPFGVASDAPEGAFQESSVAGATKPVAELGGS